MNSRINHDKHMVIDVVLHSLTVDPQRNLVNTNIFKDRLLLIMKFEQMFEKIQAKIIFIVTFSFTYD
ncbi:MAG: hypothetical protein ACKVN8_02915 [Nitrosarchaeum sp.]|nr:MAG: hypothetical protein CK527_04530 [Nitrosarchaeum sp.]